MSTADGRRRGPVRSRAARAGQQGFSLLEIVIVLVLMALMALLVERTLASTHAAESFLGAVRKATERGQGITYEVRDLVASSRKLFSDDAIGPDYLAALDLSRDPMAAGARLPVLDEVNELGPDAAGDPRTGNVLFFVREADAEPVVADPATKKIRYIDMYRFVCVYPHLTNVNVVMPTGTAPKLDALDLVIWRSEKFPGYGQIMAIDDSDERESVVKDLVNRFDLDTAWDANAPADAAFYAMDSLGNVASSPSVGFAIPEDLELSDRGKLVYAKVQLARTDVDANRSKRFVTDAWNPNGFEVKIAGTSGSRQVWMHIIVEVQASLGRVAVQPCTVIAFARDL